jgi:hypothetical protein
VKARLRAIARRRRALLAEIRRQRAAQRVTIAALRQELAFAGLGLIAGRLLARRPWLRALALGALAAVATRRGVAHSWHSRRTRPTELRSRRAAPTAAGSRPAAPAV